ncbi:MAG: hypothetical protein ACK4TB_02960 [Gemmobacter sp.]
MGVTEDLADALARDVLDRQDALGDDRFYEKVGRVIGTSSPTLQEAFLTAIRIRLAERRARAFLDAAVAAKAAGQDAPDAPRDHGSGH